MIRKMYPSDKDGVIRVLKSANMFTPSEVALAIEQIDIYLANPNQRDYNLMILESEDFQNIGFMSYGPAPLAEDVYNLYWIAVHPRAQGKGHGRELILWLEERVQSASTRMILVETSSLAMYKPTREFYRAMDFKKISRVPDFYKPGDDRITYVKYFKKKEKKNYGPVAEYATSEF